MDWYLRIVVALSANYMPARTALGSEALRQCLAFQRFVRAAEKKRIEVLAKDDPTLLQTVCALCHGARVCRPLGRKPSKT